MLRYLEFNANTGQTGHALTVKKGEPVDNDQVNNNQLTNDQLQSDTVQRFKPDPYRLLSHHSPLPQTAFVVVIKEPRDSWYHLHGPYETKEAAQVVRSPFLPRKSEYRIIPVAVENFGQLDSFLDTTLNCSPQQIRQQTNVYQYSDNPRTIFEANLKHDYWWLHTTPEHRKAMCVLNSQTASTEWEKDIVESFAGKTETEAKRVQCLRRYRRKKLLFQIRALPYTHDLLYRPNHVTVETLNGYVYAVRF